MNGEWLALGVVGVMAAAGTLRGGSPNTIGFGRMSKSQLVQSILSVSGLRMGSRPWVRLEVRLMRLTVPILRDVYRDVRQSLETA